MNRSPGLPHFSFDYSSLCETLSLAASKLSDLRSRLFQSYERKNLSVPCINSTIPKHNICHFGDKGKLACRKEEEKDGPKTFKRTFNHLLTFMPPNEATESHLIKPMRQEVVRGYLNEAESSQLLWQAASALSSYSIESQRQRAPK